MSFVDHVAPEVSTSSDTQSEHAQGGSLSDPLMGHMVQMDVGSSGALPSGGGGVPNKAGSDETVQLKAAVQFAGGDRHHPPDDRHHITDPYTNIDQWVLTMKKTRIAELFLTLGGLPGHVTQVQQEIKRVTSDRNRRKMEGMDGGQVTQLIAGLREVRDALVSAAEAAAFDFAKFKIEFHGLVSDLYLSKTGGKLKTG